MIPCKVDGKSGFAVFLDGDMKPVEDKAKAKFVRVTFDDGSGLLGVVTENQSTVPVAEG